MGIGWIIALSVIGAFIILLLCFFMFSALILSGKAERQREKDLEMAMIDDELLNELHFKLIAMTVNLCEVNALCENSTKKFELGKIGFHYGYADLQELNEDITTTINDVNKILYLVQTIYTTKNHINECKNSTTETENLQKGM